MFCKSGIDNDLIRYNDLCIQFNSLAMTRYNSYISKIESNLTNNPGGFWQFINNKRHVRGFPSEIRYNNVLGSDAATICNIPFVIPFVICLLIILKCNTRHMMIMFWLMVIWRIFGHLIIWLIY